MYLPASTYRIQLNSKYTFVLLESIVGYLDLLGISTIYAAPIVLSSNESTHGYDVCDPDSLNPAIGSLDQFLQVTSELKKHHMGWLQDIVPNHMAFLSENSRIFDVLERGEDSPYYQYFDINWHHPDPAYTHKVMIPFLGENFDIAVEDGSLVFMQNERGFHIDYHGILYPLSEESYRYLKFPILPNMKGTLAEWKSQKKEWLQKLKNTQKVVTSIIDQHNLDKRLLRELLQQQHYTLTCYKKTNSEIDYRRFFTINQLICLSMETEFVFKDYHAFMGELYKKGLMQGLRVDHVDGLYHPGQYISRLRKEFGEECFIIVEKILEYNEDLNSAWDIQGTSGYEFLSYVNQLLTSQKGSRLLLNYYKKLLPTLKEYHEIVFEKKYKFLKTYMGGELQNLVSLLEELKLFDYSQDSHEKTKEALAVLMASFPVYRIYPDHYPLNPHSIAVVDKTFKEAFLHTHNSLIEIGKLKELFYADGTHKKDQARLKFIKRMMQFTGQLAAKGVEDTTFYVYNPLISHNEVGDSPDCLGVTIQEFHEKMVRRLQSNAYSLNATSTHDTKRGEDARMRINAISELAPEWIAVVDKWRVENRVYKKVIDGKECPSSNEEYFIYQSLIGSFPVNQILDQKFLERTHEFIVKALREEKEATSHDEPHQEYEEGCFQFIAQILKPENSFFKSFIPFLNKILKLSLIYSLEQVIIKICAPGIPDIYQGCELWDLSYVDPDNRRPVDYKFRKELLDKMISMPSDKLLDFIRQHREDGYEKFFVTYKSLNYRRSHQDLFLKGSYIPILCDQKLVAFARHYENEWLLVLLPINRQEMFQRHETVDQADMLTLPPNMPTQWTNLFTEAEHKGPLLLVEVFKDLEVAVLYSKT